MRRDWMTWKAETENKDLKQSLKRVVTEAQPSGDKYVNKVGVLVLLDMDVVTDVKLEELADTLMQTKHEVDTYNEDNDTVHYFMMVLILYNKEEKDRRDDERVASANSILLALNSFMKRPTLDLNRYLLDGEAGRPINIRYEEDKRVNPSRYTESGYSDEALEL